jgi:hypothetical protein
MLKAICWKCGKKMRLRAGSLIDDFRDTIKPNGCIGYRCDYCEYSYIVWFPWEAVK